MGRFVQSVQDAIDGPVTWFRGKNLLIKLQIIMDTPQQVILHCGHSNCSGLNSLSPLITIFAIT